MTLEEDMDDRRTTCATCNNSGIGDPRDWHHYRHPYRGTWKPASSSQSPQGAAPGTPLRVPFDPVLRLALIRKGVITPDDLKDAEHEISVTTMNFMTETWREMQRGENNDVPGRSTFGR